MINEKQTINNKQLKTKNEERTMKIIIFDGTFKTTAFIRRLIQGLIKANHEVFVLGFNEVNPNPIGGVNYVKLGNNQNKFSFLKTGLSWAMKSNAWLKYLNYFLKSNKKYIQQLNLEKALHHIQPDMVHLQWVSNIGLFEPFLEKKQYNFVLSQRGYQTNVRPFVNQENFEYLEKWLPKFKGFHSVSKAISKVGDKIYKHPQKIDQVVYTGLDFIKFQYQDAITKNQHLKIISVGRPHWKKGYDIAIRSLSQLKLKGIDFLYQIVGGKGDEELLFLINELNLTHQVELLDQKPQQEVFNLMQSADVFLLPSLEEGIANVAVEAMALGVPVISTDCGGMQELITHHKEGWIVPTYDIDAIADQLFYFSQLAENKIREVKKAARKKIEKQHNEEQMVNGMLDLYNQVTKENKNQASKF